MLLLAAAAFPALGGEGAQADRRLEVVHDQYAQCMVAAEDRGYYCHQACLKPPEHCRDAGDPLPPECNVRTCYGVCEYTMKAAMDACQRARVREEQQIMR
jgi:hypothetical protein